MCSMLWWILYIWEALVASFPNLILDSCIGNKGEKCWLWKVALHPYNISQQSRRSLCISFAICLSGVNDEDMTPMHTTMIGAWNGVEEVQQGFPSQEGGPRLIRFESPRWRPKAIQVRVQFGVQEQCAIKRTPRSHTKLVLDVLYMVGSRISSSFQGHRSRAKIHPESTGIVETN
jgi:hypothetical protein